jgi:hypothetical protein
MVFSLQTPCAVLVFAMVIVCFVLHNIDAAKPVQVLQTLEDFHAKRFCQMSSYLYVDMAHN